MKKKMTVLFLIIAALAISFAGYAYYTMKVFDDEGEVIRSTIGEFANKEGVKEVSLNDLVYEGEGDYRATLSIVYDGPIMFSMEPFSRKLLFEISDELAKKKVKYRKISFDTIDQKGVLSPEYLVEHPVNVDGVTFTAGYTEAQVAHNETLMHSSHASEEEEKSDEVYHNDVCSDLEDAAKTAEGENFLDVDVKCEYWTHGNHQMIFEATLFNRDTYPESIVYQDFVKELENRPDLKFNNVETIITEKWGNEITVHYGLATKHGAK